MDQNNSLLAFANPARKYTPAAGGKRKVNKTKILNTETFRESRDSSVLDQQIQSSSTIGNTIITILATRESLNI